MQENREQWSSKTSFILAAAGSAVTPDSGPSGGVICVASISRDLTLSFF